MCLLKYLVQYPKKCPLCRTKIATSYTDFKTNVVLDYISRKFNGRKYSRIFAQHEQEAKVSNVYERLAQKYQGDQGA